MGDRELLELVGVAHFGQWRRRRVPGKFTRGCAKSLKLGRSSIVRTGEDKSSVDLLLGAIRGERGCGKYPGRNGRRFAAVGQPEAEGAQQLTSAEMRAVGTLLA